jgi:hypothetical protein
MTDFQMSLIIIGALIVVAVISYNKWQEFKARRSVERAFDSPQDDVLMRPGEAPAAKAEPALAPLRERQEPMLAPLGGAAAGPGAETADALSTEPATTAGVGAYAGANAAEGFDDGGDIRAAHAPSSATSATPAAETHANPVPGFSDPTQFTNPLASEGDIGMRSGLLQPAAVEEPMAPPAPAGPVQPELPLDPQIDCLVPITLETPVRGDKLLTMTQTLRHIGGKPVQYIGMRDDGVWETVSQGGIYHGLQSGVQMANRAGPLNELEYSEYVSRLRQVADDLGAELELADMMDIMKTARLLHQFIAEYGAQLSVNVQASRAPWQIESLLAALERQGFELRADGRLAMPDGDGGTLFSISTNAAQNAASTTRLTLLLDVPCVAPSRDGFGAMVACARSLATRLDGVVVDDGNQPLSTAALEEIASQVEAFYGEMEGVQVTAGSVRALRLFN